MQADELVAAVMNVSRRFSPMSGQIWNRNGPSVMMFRLKIYV